MAQLLYRLGRFSALRPWRIIAGWVVALLLAVVAFLSFGGTLSQAISIPGTPTQQVTDELSEVLPEAAGASGQIVFSVPQGETFSPEQTAAVSAALADLNGIDGVTAVVDPFASEAERQGQLAELAAGREQIEASRAELEASQPQLEAGIAAAEAGGDADQAAALTEQLAQVTGGLAELQGQEMALSLGERTAAMAEQMRTVSADGSAAIGVVMFAEPTGSVPAEVRDAVVDTISGHDLAGVEVAYSTAIVQEISGILGIGEVIGVIVAGIVLLVMLRALAPAVVPILSALVGVGVGVTATMALSGSVEMMSVTPILGVMLGLAVGIDYSLFILNRHRRQLRRGMERTESIGLAVGTSGNAVVFAGVTVIIALAALNVTGIGFLGLMGSVAAFCVAVAVLVAITFTPAVLSLVGTRVLPVRQRAAAPEPATAEHPKPMGTPRAVVTLVAGIAALCVVAIPALSMRLGLPDGTSEPEDSTAYAAHVVTAERFGEGVTSPLLVVAEMPEPDRAVWPTGADQALTTQVAETIFATPDVVAVVPAGGSQDGRVVAFQVIPTEGANSESTADLVHTLRALSADTESDLGVTLGVAGAASGNIDISEKLADALPLYLGLVLGLSLIIMILVFRSILVPVMATVGFLLSVFATFGAVVAIYQWGWLSDLFGVHSPGPVLSFLPTILIGVLFGLAMDYQLFLVSGMREAHVHGVPARSAVTEGFHAGRAVVTAAAIIMISVFGGFIFSHLGMVRPMGFGLAFGVLVDAFVVRMAIIPALMHLVGEKAWWIPRWLDRILPDVDVEGAALERHDRVLPAGPANEPTSVGA